MLKTFLLSYAELRKHQNCLHKSFQISFYHDIKRHRKASSSTTIRNQLSFPITQCTSPPPCQKKQATIKKQTESSEIPQAKVTAHTSHLQCLRKSNQNTFSPLQSNWQWVIIVGTIFCLTLEDVIRGWRSLNGFFCSN